MVEAKSIERESLTERGNLRGNLSAKAGRQQVSPVFGDYQGNPPYIPCAGTKRNQAAHDHDGRRRCQRLVLSVFCCRPQALGAPRCNTGVPHN